MASSTGAEGAAETHAAAGAAEADTETGSSPTRSSGENQRGEGAPGSAADAHGPLASEALGSAERASCIMNAHYHGAREGFLDTTHRWFMLAVIVLGATAFADLVPKNDGDHHESWLKGLFGAGAALFGALDLTFDLSNRARAHSLMKRRYYDLLADLREGSKNAAEARACLDRFSAAVDTFLPVDHLRRAPGRAGEVRDRFSLFHVRRLVVRARAATGAAAIERQPWQLGRRVTVKAHWRRQPVGPRGSGETRRTWIGEHHKGPLDGLPRQPMQRL